MRPWRIPILTSKRTLRALSTSFRAKFEDEGSWSYSPEWWGSDSDHHSRSVFQANSLHGNGVVSVLAYRSSIPVSFPLLLSFTFFVFAYYQINFRICIRSNTANFQGLCLYTLFFSILFILLLN